MYSNKSNNIHVRNAKLDLSPQHQHHQFQNPYRRQKDKKNLSPKKKKKRGIE